MAKNAASSCVVTRLEAFRDVVRDRKRGAFELMAKRGTEGKLRRFQEVQHAVVKPGRLLPNGQLLKPLVSGHGPWLRHPTPRVNAQGARRSPHRRDYLRGKGSEAGATDCRRGGPDRQSPISNTPNRQYPIAASPSPLPHCRCPIADAPSLIPNRRSPSSSTVSQSAIGYWLLAIGCRRLALSVCPKSDGRRRVKRLPARLPLRSARPGISRECAVMDWCFPPQTSSSATFPVTAPARLWHNRPPCMSSVTSGACCTARG
jgi:hypothetical protein